MKKEKQIKSTDWLVKGYSQEELARIKEKAIEEYETELRKKQIDEMAKEICHSRTCELRKSGRNCYKYCKAYVYAFRAYNANYHKQREGHWFIREYEYFTCSECGHDYYNGCEYTQEAKERLADGKYPNFCPNCGAKMKGGGE